MIVVSKSKIMQKLKLSQFWKKNLLKGKNLKKKTEKKKKKTHKKSAFMRRAFYFILLLRLSELLFLSRPMDEDVFKKQFIG